MVDPTHNPRKPHWTIIGVLALSLLYATYWSWFDLTRHAKTNSTRFDLGNAEQIIWNGAHGRWFQSTDPYGTATVSRLAYHADFFLMVLVPVYALAPYTQTLLLLQVLAIASSFLAVYLLARAWTKSAAWGFGLAALFAISPALHWMTLFDFHAVAFAVPLILWAVWAMHKQRYGWMFVLAGLAMLTKEEIGMTLLPLAAMLWFWKKQPRLAWLMVLPAVWSLAMLTWAIPHAQSAVDAADVFRSSFGNTTGQVVKNLIIHPRMLWGTVTSPATIHYALQLLIPFGWLPLGNWLSLGAGPDALINVISGKETQQTIFFHYAGGMLAWMMLGTIGVIAWVRKQWPDRIFTFAIAGWLLVWGGAGAWLYGPLPGAKLDHTRFATWRNENAAPIASWEKRIPTSAAVSATNNIGSHFARRQAFYSFPLGLQQADYAIVLQGHALPEVTDQAGVDAALAELQANPHWRTVFHQADLTILARQP